MQPAPQNATTFYKAFISYSHAADGRLAPALQYSLRRIGKPWYRRAPFRIFLDNSSLSANPALWDSIEAALRASEYYILLASTHSAQSEWVERELDWWLDNRSVEKLIIVVTDGEIVWHSGAEDFDWQATTALNPRLRKAFREEPLYVDLRWARTEKRLSLRNPRFRSDLLQVAPPLYGRSREDLDDEDLRQYRSARRMAVIAVFLLVALVVATAAASYVAREQQDVAGCRELAAQASGLLNTRLDLALLLGVESSRRSSCIEGRSTLLTALEYRPHLAGFLSGHTDMVTTVEYAPDGQVMASSSWDRTVRLWDMRSRKALKPVLKGMYGLSFSPDGKILASSDGQSITLWNLPSGTAAGELPFDRRYQMSRVSFSPDGKMLATSNEPTGTVPSEVFLWNAFTKQLLGPTIPAHVFAFSPDSKVIATDGEDGKRIMLRDVRTRRVIGKALAGHTGTVRTMAFSTEGEMLASGGADNAVVVWDLRDPQRHGTALTGHRAPVNAVAFNREGTMLASASGDGTVILWDVEKLKPIGSPLAVGEKPIFGLAFSPDSRTLVSTSGDERVVIWDVLNDVSPGREFAALTEGSFGRVAFSPDGKTLAFLGQYGEVSLGDAATGRVVHDSIGSRVTDVAFSPDGKLLATVGWDGGFALWNTTTGEPADLAEKTKFRLFSVAFRPDGKTIAIGGDAVLLVWDTAQRRWRGSPNERQKDRIWRVVFSPDGKLLASAGNTTLGLWQAESGAAMMDPVITDREHKYLLPADAAFSPDGKLLAYREGKSGVVLWDVAQRRAVGPLLNAHKGVVTSIAFAADGKFMATGGSDGAVVLWDRATRQPLGRPFSGAGGSISSLAFRPDGAALAVAGEKRIVIWGVSEERWREAACRIANRNLTPGEWTRFFGAAAYRNTCP